MGGQGLYVGLDWEKLTVSMKTMRHRRVLSSIDCESFIMTVLDLHSTIGIVRCQVTGRTLIWVKVPPTITLTHQPLMLDVVRAP